MRPVQLLAGPVGSTLPTLPFSGPQFPPWFSYFFLGFSEWCLRATQVVQAQAGSERTSGAQRLLVLPQF